MLGFNVENHKDKTPGTSKQLSGEASKHVESKPKANSNASLALHDGELRHLPAHYKRGYMIQSDSYYTEFKLSSERFYQQDFYQDLIDRYMVGLLNSDGGTVYIGVEEDGKVLGVPLSNADGKTFVEKIEEKTNMTDPKVESGKYKVVYVPVEDSGADRDGRKRYVIVLLVPRQEGKVQVYKNSHGDFYIMMDGTIKRLKDVEEIYHASQKMYEDSIKEMELEVSKKREEAARSLQAYEKKKKEVDELEKTLRTEIEEKKKGVRILQEKIHEDRREMEITREKNERLEKGLEDMFENFKRDIQAMKDDKLRELRRRYEETKSEIEARLK